MHRISFILTVIALVMGTTLYVAQAQDDDDRAEVPFGQTITAELAAQLPITDDVRYEVGTADTADDIAALFDIDLACLVQTNNLQNPNVIQVGDELLIDADCPPYLGLNYVAFPRQAAADGNGETYTVRVADTLDEIAFAFNVSLVSLIEFNDIERPGQILPGQVLQIPTDAPPYGRVPASASNDFDPDAGIIYVVQPLDTLDVIGAFYDASVTCIADTNGIDNPLLLQPRTTLFIPDDCPPYTGVNLATRGRIVPAEEDISDSIDASTPTPTPAAIVTDEPTDTPAPEIEDTTPEATETTSDAPADSQGNIIDTLQAITDAASSAEVTTETTEEPSAEETEEPQTDDTEEAADVGNLLDTVGDLLGGDE